MVKQTCWGYGIGLKERVILFGVSGGIACYKAASYLRALKNEGARVIPVLTKNAARFVSPLTFSALSGEEARLDLFNGEGSGEIPHIELTKKADVFLVCPATANIIAKAAGGIADDLLSTMFLAYKGPILFFPSMNPAMYGNPATQENIKRLRARGHMVIEPEEGKMACGDAGKGRLVEFEDFMYAVKHHFFPKPLLGKKVLVTAGPTREPIDPVRFLSNRSSGKMGYGVAWAADALGAEVHLVTGPSSVKPPRVTSLVYVETTEEMRKAVLEKFPAMDISVMAAAVSDYAPMKRFPKKIKKRGGGKGLSLELRETPDILKELIQKKTDEQVIVGFCAETGDLLENAIKKMKKKPVDIMVCNDVTIEGAGFEVDTNKIIILYSKGNEAEELPLLSKVELGLEIMKRVSGLFHGEISSLV